MTRRRRRTNLNDDSTPARRMRLRRSNETQEQSDNRLRSQAERQAEIRAAQCNVLRNSWASLNKAAFNYDPTVAYNTHPMLDIGSMNEECRFCAALKWRGECAGMCCSNGKVQLPLLEEPPELLKSLLSADSEKSRHFLLNTRKYNSCFQMTSFGADKEVHHGGFQPTFIIQGQIYHKIGSLLPSLQTQPKFLQMYFIGDDGDDSNQVDQRCTAIAGVRRDIVTDLQSFLHAVNPLVRQFKTALENMPNSNYQVVIYADRTPVGQQPGRFNAPVTHDVAVVMSGNSFGSRDIVLNCQDGALKRIADTHRYYDALQYPLIFWKAQEGYTFGIPHINPATNQPLARKTVSSMEFYAFHLMCRRNNYNHLLRYKLLLHQFVVDMYVKIESERLRYIQLHQSQLRAESYIHLRDAISTDANVDANNLGQMVILPSSFVNSARYLAEYTQDAFCYVRSYGRPDLFITFTTNPTWPEIIAELKPGEKQTDRHDLTARVFRQKLIKLVGVLTKGNIFGATQAFMYSIEWQKRGLPHCHILIWLKEKIYPSQMDKIVSAELPDPNADPELSNVVLKNMIHGPCGDFNPRSPCMKNGHCTKKYPRQFLIETVTNQNGYPLYKRRSPNDGGLNATIQIRSAGDVTIDNKWVVPYSPLLSKMFSAHINVEICSSVQAIKYICKYINKGSDQAVFNIETNDEVKRYQSGRYVSTNEGFWRIYGLPLHERHPAVIHLAVHLENGERIYFNRNNLEDRVRNPTKTTLTAFFDLCQRDNFAKTLLYTEVPQFYTFDKRNKAWQRRKQGVPVENWNGVKKSDAIGRVYTVEVTKSECYCLRLLLQHVRGPTCFDNLKIVDGQLCETYREACTKLGLLESDQHWHSTLEEAVLSRSPHQIRKLFAILISACGVSNPYDLWNSFKDAMTEDILHRHCQINANAEMTVNMHNEALCLIEDHVMTMCGKNLSEFGLLRPQRNVEPNILLDKELNYNAQALSQNIAAILPTLLPEQRNVYNYVMGKIETNQQAIIFLDAPGGTGKTYLLNLLLSKVRSQGCIALALASSGIASTLLVGGQTAHSMLKLPLDLARDENPACNISKNTSRATLLQQCKLIVWDEATMSNKKAFEALDRTLKDLRNDSRLMGGLVVLLAGDFRQTLPIVRRGTPADEVDACLKSSVLWPHVTKMKLTKNMRVHLSNDSNAATFSSNLLQIGEGTVKPESDGKIRLIIARNISTQETLIENVFSNIENQYSDLSWLSERAILAPKNERVNIINDKIAKLIPGEEKVFNSVDSAVEEAQATSYPTEFLNSLELSGTPSHKITLKIGEPIILMRNLDAPRLCNGTRLVVTNLGTNIIKAKILTGNFRGEEAMIPRIPIIPTELPFQFKRLQFPIKLAFAMTVNKSQGQTMKVVGVDLEEPCFAHGQLYVACSRVSSKENLFISCENEKTFNIVYKKALE